MAEHASFTDKVIGRLGRRGAILTLMSFIYFLLGIKVIFAPAFDAEHFGYYALLPIPVRYVLWFVAAGLGFYGALIKRGKNDAIGFAALCIPAAILISSYLTTTVAFLFGLTNFGTGWVDALEWAAIFLVLIITSGWKESCDCEDTVIPLPEKDD